MYKCVSLRAAEIRKKLKAIGYNSRMISVRSSSFSGGDDIVIRMKSTDVDEAMVNSDIQIVDVSELTNGNPIDFDALEPYQDDIDVDPDNGHVIALTSFINHFYE